LNGCLFFSAARRYFCERRAERFRRSRQAPRDGGKTAPQAAADRPVLAGAIAAESGAEARGPAGEWGDEPGWEVSIVCLAGLARTVLRKVGQ
jgi:hypothetical protein